MTNELWIALLSFCAGMDLMNGVWSENITYKIIDFVAFGLCAIAVVLRVLR